MIQLLQDGIIIVDDIAYFDKTTIEQLSANICSPTGRVQYLNHSDNVDAMILSLLFMFGARSRTRITTALELVRYYDTVDPIITLSNMTWYQNVKNFQFQRKALEEKKENDKPDIPAITNTLHVIKWTKSFRDYLHHRIGARTITLTYVVYSNVNVPSIGMIETRKPHLEEHGSNEDEIIVQVRHTHLLYCEYNAAVYYLL